MVDVIYCDVSDYTEDLIWVTIFLNNFDKISIH